MKKIFAIITVFTMLFLNTVETILAFDIEKVTIIGGSKAVSEDVIEFIKEAIKNRKN